MENKILYSILFLKGRNGTTIKELSIILKTSEKEIKEKISNLTNELSKNDSPLELKNNDEKVRLTVTKETSLELSNVMDKTINVSLTKSVLEALTIIAYKQPVTKGKIEHIRGVSADYAISKLFEYDLIESNERADLPGKPRLYVTTNTFLELFDFNSLSDLPKGSENFEERQVETSLFVYDNDDKNSEEIENNILKQSKEKNKEINDDENSEEIENDNISEQQEEKETDE